MGMADELANEEIGGRARNFARRATSRFYQKQNDLKTAPRRLPNHNAQSNKKLFLQALPAIHLSPPSQCTGRQRPAETPTDVIT